MFTRRSLLKAGSAGLLAAHCSVCAADQPSRRTVGCLLAPEDADTIKSKASPVWEYSISDAEAPILKSGNAMFDLALAQTLAKIAKAFDVLPSFAFYDDSGSPNAFATTRVTLDRNDGSVFFGLGLLKRMMSLPEAPEVAVATVSAHEFGHILQYKHNLIDRVTAGQPTVKRCELQADYFAGYFSGLRKLQQPSYPAAVAAVAQFSVGDTQFASPSHHGTPQERGAATARGFEASYREKKSLSDAIEESCNYVMTL
jgi:hypothetical protein